MKRIAAMALLPLVSLADPAPFGLEMGVATVDDARERSRLDHVGLNRYGHQHYRLNPSDLDMAGLKEASAFFDEEGRLAVVLTVYDKARFDFLYDGLRSRYHTVSEEIPFVGNKSARFEDGNTTIDLDAPHLSFTLSLHYWNSDLLRRVEGNFEAERAQQEARELDQL